MIALLILVVAATGFAMPYVAYRLRGSKRSWIPGVSLAVAAAVVMSLPHLREHIDRVEETLSAIAGGLLGVFSLTAFVLGNLRRDRGQ